MRLQLATLLGVLAITSVASAQAEEAGEGQATSRVLVYSDDDATTVTTTAVDGEVLLPASIQVGGHVLVDAVSSASVDVVSAATERWEEDRLELGVRASADVSAVEVSLSYTHSQENDWRSHSVSIGSSKELFQKNTTISGFYSFTANVVGRASDPNFERSLDAHSAEISVGQLVDPATRVGATYSLQLLSGYQSSPYRYVSAADGTRVPERHPDSRARHALALTAVRALGDLLAVRGSYRLYVDDWGITSHTASVRGAIQLGQRAVVGLEGRGYLQSRAHFYRGTYDTSYQYVSFDRELSRFRDGGGFADLRVAFGPVVTDVKVGMIHYRFAEFPALPRRTALLAGGGARLTW